jgi:hypothetical protein
MKFDFFSADFRKELKFRVLSKSIQWEPSCCMRTDRQTDGHGEVSIRFSKVSEIAENMLLYRNYIAGNNKTC